MESIAELPTLWVQPKYEGREATKALCGARQLGYAIGWGQNAPDKFVPIGSVDYCESILGFSPVPDFAPVWLQDYFHRNIATVHCRNQITFADCFVKSARKYKEWPARIIKAGEPIPDGWLLISDVVEFVQEWRYYVADGTVLTTGWYDGNDDDEPAPELDIDWPKGWCGAADFGRLSTGEIALVECQHPYACGWYGDDHAAFVMWLVEGWKYMTHFTRRNTP